MSFMENNLSKVGSDGSLLSPDNDSESIPNKSDFVNENDVHKSLENILLDGVIYSTEIDNSSVTSQNGSLINFNIFDDDNDLNSQSEPELKGECISSEDVVSSGEAVRDVNNITQPVSDMSTNFSMEHSTQSANKVMNEDVVAVGFEEDKGTKSLPPAASTRSLMKFFADSPVGVGGDIEGKNFFDSFTTAQVDGNSSNIDVGLVIKNNNMHNQNTSSLSPSTNLYFEPSSMGNSDIQVAYSGTTNLVETTFETSNLQGQQTFSCRDRSYDAWLPSEKTRQALLTVLYNGPNVIVPFPMSELTLPGVIIEESLGDPIRDLLMKHIGEQEANKRLVLTADSVPQDQIGLQQLIKADCLRAAVDQTSKLLTACGQGPGKMNQISNHTPYSLQLWFCRLSLLARLHLYGPAECEWQPFGDLDNPDLYYEFHQSKQPGKKGSMVPFEMRVSHADFPQHIGRHQESLDRLYSLFSILNKIISNLKSNLSEDGSNDEMTDSERQESLSLWLKRERRILYCIANCLLAVKDHNNCLKTYRILLTKDPDQEHHIRSAMGRVYLQVGDIERAEYQFSKVVPSQFISEKAYNIQDLTNKALVELGLSKYNDAFQSFRKVCELDRTNTLAINNMCVCALYLEKLKGTLKQLELLIYSTPKLYLQEILILNLCTLYELESSKSNIKKQNLLRLVGQHKGTGFNISCLKMT